MPLGLISSEQSSTWWSQNVRRKIFYSYPNGTAPLTGLLSLADTEDTPFSQFGWHEERWYQMRVTTVAGPTSNTVFYLGGTTTTAGATFTPTAGTAYRIYLSDATLWQQDDMLKIHQLPYGSTTTEASFRVVSTNTVANPQYAEVICVTTAPGAVTNNAASVVGLQVVHSGSSFAQGSRSRSGRYRYPSQIMNYSQIHKTAFEMTRNALKEPLKYDKTGDYRNQLKANGIDHMAGMEWTFLFQDRYSETAVDPDTGSTSIRNYVGGILWFLKQWETGSVANGGAFDYRPNATNLTGVTDYVNNPDKRIIRLNGGSVTLDTFNWIESLPFRKTNSTEWCKLCLAGPGYLASIDRRYRQELTQVQLRGEMYDGWDFKVVKRTSLSGDIYYKQHPLFVNAPEMNNSAFYIDLGYLKYRPVTDSDTDIQQMIQENDADKRKDQWLTDAGLECPYPEAHMYVENLGGIN